MKMVLGKAHRVVAKLVRQLTLAQNLCKHPVVQGPVQGGVTRLYFGARANPAQVK